MIQLKKALKLGLPDFGTLFFCGQTGFGWSNGVVLAFLEEFGWSQGLKVGCE